jgi:hypothetical protein
MTPYLSRSSMSSNGQPAEIRPSQNLSKLSQYFVFEVFKKNCDSGWCKNGASCWVLKTSPSVDPRRNLAPTKKLPRWHWETKKAPTFSLNARGYQQAAEAMLGKGFKEQRNEPLVGHSPSSARRGRSSLWILSIPTRGSRDICLAPWAAGVPHFPSSTTSTPGLPRFSHLAGEVGTKYSVRPAILSKGWVASCLCLATKGSTIKQNKIAQSRL